MVPVVHKRGGSFGHSFKGCGLYLLEGSDRQSQDRVAWTETRNLATNNPHAAWRVMAATAMDAGRLKQQAGVPSVGRKPGGPVMHVSIRWRDGEVEHLTREEMVRAANGVIRFLGAQDRQVLIVAHRDHKEPHVHLMINRVSPVTGKSLSSSFDFRKLSRWAQKYEEENGKILCEQRVINNAARDRGEYVKGEPRKPRHIQELEAGHHDTPGAKTIAIEQKKLDLDMRTRTRQMRSRHAKQLDDLVRRARAERSKIHADAVIQIAQTRKRVRIAYRPAWEARFKDHQADLRAFHDREGQVIGRFSNALRSIDFGRLLSGNERGRAITEAYNALGSSGSRLDAFKRGQRAKDHALECEQRAAEASAVRDIKAKTGSRLDSCRDRFAAARTSLVLKHDLERAGNRSEWRTRAQQRSAAWQRHTPRRNDGGGRPRVASETVRSTTLDPNLQDLLEAYQRRQVSARARRQDRGDEHDHDGHGR